MGFTYLHDAVAISNESVRKLLHEQGFVEVNRFKHSLNVCTLTLMEALAFHVENCTSFLIVF